MWGPYTCRRQKTDGTQQKRSSTGSLESQQNRQGRWALGAEGGGGGAGSLLTEGDRALWQASLRCPMTPAFWFL